MGGLVTGHDDGAQEQYCKKLNCTKVERSQRSQRVLFREDPNWVIILVESFELNL